MEELYERVYSRVGYKDNLRIWGQLNLSKTGRTIGGWLVNSWSELGAPYWQSKLHWLDKGDKKLYRLSLKIGQGINLINTQIEDTDIESERSKFIREMVERWETEWLQEEAKIG